ncbi:MAG: hypothetical protein E7283_02420 [Lachnospiraceae bacterium]|nr:hypothetical protein [Lachnospiraceae bacterium]
MFRVTLGQGSSTTYSYVSSSTTSVSQVFETIASESNIADKKIKALKAAADATIEEMLLNSPYLKDAYYVVEDGKLKIKGVAGGTIDGIASWYKLENVAKNEKLTNLLIQMDNYAKLNELSKWMGNVGNVFEKGSVLTGSLSEIFDENNETLADKAGGVASEVIVAFAEDKASQFAMWIATKMLSAGAKGASAGTVAGPMGIIVGAAAGLLASLAVDYIANIEVEDKSIKEWIADYASEAADVVGNAIVDASTAVWDWTTATANDIMENVSTTTENVVNWAQDTIENAWNTIEDSTAETLDWITNSGAAFASWITSW